METRDTLHEVRGRVVTEVRGDIANPQPASTAEQTFGVGIDRATEAGHLETVGGDHKIIRS